MDALWWVGGCPVTGLVSICVACDVDCLIGFVTGTFASEDIGFFSVEDCVLALASSVDAGVDGIRASTVKGREVLIKSTIRKKSKFSKDFSFAIFSV